MTACSQSCQRSPRRRPLPGSPTALRGCHYGRNGQRQHHHKQCRNAGPSPEQSDNVPEHSAPQKQVRPPAHNRKQQPRTRRPGAQASGISQRRQSSTMETIREVKWTHPHRHPSDKHVAALPSKISRLSLVARVIVAVDLLQLAVERSRRGVVGGAASQPVVWCAVPSVG